MKTYADGALTLTPGSEATVLTLDRPGRRNAICAAIWRDLPAALAAARPDRPLLVRGGSGDFAAGADIIEFDQVFADRASALAYQQTMARALAALAAWPGPTLAWIEGHCIGAGLALALACDLRLSSDDARFGVTPARLGLVYPLADTRRLVHAVGESKARDLLYTGRLFDAGEALALRLVDELHGATVLEAAVQAKAGLIARQSGASVCRAKAVVALAAAGQTDDDERTRGWFADAAVSEDHRRRRAAFLARSSTPNPG